MCALGQLSQPSSREPPRPQVVARHHTAAMSGELWRTLHHRFGVLSGTAFSSFLLLSTAFSVTQSVHRAVAPLDDSCSPSSTASTKFLMHGECRLGCGGRFARPPAQTSTGSLSGVRSISPSLPIIRNSSL